MQNQIKFEDKQIKVSENPVFIVGQNPGRQRKDAVTSIVWEGNRSSDFLMECIDGLENIYLTNVCNYQQMTDDLIVEGTTALRAKIDYLQPRRIITLGEFASFHMAHIDPSAPITHFFHPSFIVRFNKDREEYKEQIRKAITS